MFLKCHDFFKTYDDRDGRMIINVDMIRFVRPHNLYDDGVNPNAFIDLFDTDSIEIDFVATTSFDEFKEFILTLPNFILVHDSERDCSVNEIIFNTKYIQMIRPGDGYSEIDITGADNTTSFWVDESMNDLKDVIVSSCARPNSSLIFRTFGDD